MTLKKILTLFLLSMISLSCSNIEGRDFETLSETGNSIDSLRHALSKLDSLNKVVGEDTILSKLFDTSDRRNGLIDSSIKPGKIDISNYQQRGSPRR